MNINTGGPIRGFVARWLMRFQAVQGFIQMGSMMVTAASTLTFALQAIGYTEIAPYVLGIGLFGTPAFAWAYTELGLFNRKNREKSDRGANWAGPDAFMNSVIGAMGTYYAMNQDVPDSDEFEELQQSVELAWREYRDGINLDDD